MSLLVPNEGELQTLRYLVNSEENIPRNLILKLFSSNTTPAEGDAPSQIQYYEPYDGSGAIGYGVAPNNGYPVVINNNPDYDYSNQYGILLNGNLWNIRTFTSPIVQTTGTGNINEYTITVTSTFRIEVGQYVTGTGIGPNATVCAINGTTLVLSVPNSGSVSGTLDFGVGTTTATYPEQVFTFSGAANNQYGYYLVRANNLPLSVLGVANTCSVSSSAGIAKTGVLGVVGNNYFTLFDEKTSLSTTGSSSDFRVFVSSTTGITTNQRVSGTNIPLGTKVVGVGATTVYLSKPNSGSVSGIVTFTKNVTENICLGMGVTHTFVPGETSAFSTGTIVSGIDKQVRRVYVNKPLVNNIQASIGSTVTFSSNRVTTPAAHGLIPGDVIYIAAGTGNTTTTSGTYTVFETPTSTTFKTSPAIGYTSGISSVTLYNSIFFAERFTNGPYNVQNDGDQIKVTLNISLD